MNQEESAKSLRKILDSRGNPVEPRKFYGDLIMGVTYVVSVGKDSLHLEYGPFSTFRVDDEKSRESSYERNVMVSHVAEDLSLLSGEELSRIYDKSSQRTQEWINERIQAS